MSRKKRQAKTVAEASRQTPSLQEAPKVGAAPLRRSRPVLPPGIPQYFIPVRKDQPDGSGLFYEPMLLGISKVYYANAKIGIATEKDISFLAEFSNSVSKMLWNDAQEVDILNDDIEKFPYDEEASFGELPGEAGKKKNYVLWSKRLKDRLYRSQKLKLLKSPSLNMVSLPDEGEREFRIRLQLASREKRDLLIERIRNKYSTKTQRLEERIRKAEQSVEKEKEQAKQQKLQTVISFGATIFSALLGRKRISRSSLGRAATTARRAGRILKEGKDVDRAEENLEELRNSYSELETLLSEEIEEVKTSMDPLQEPLEAFMVKPKKMDIAVSLTALTWTPYWQDEKGGISPAW